MLEKIAGYLKLSNFLWFSLGWTALLFFVSANYVPPLASFGIVIACLYYLFWLCYGGAWLYRKVSSFWRCFQAEGFGKAWGKLFKPVTEEEISKNIWATRGFWLFSGLLLLFASIKEDFSVALFAFVVGLMFAALISRPPENRLERAAIAGRAAFVMALTAYVFYGFDGNAGLVGWGAGLACGCATFFGEDHPQWQPLCRGGCLKKLKAGLTVLKTRFTDFLGKKS